MRTIIDIMATSLFGISKADALSKGICVNCRKPALENCYSETGKKEYEISGLCEKCFDLFTVEA